MNLPYLRGKGILLARRVTGGGAVYHDLQNLNYTITGRIRDLETDYPAYVETMARALRTLGVPAEVSGRNDILVDGRKCSGYAKRVSKDRLMIHGTLMYDVDIDTLTQVLATPGSKLSAAGISSVRSRVANLKAYLPQFEDIHAFQAALQALLVRSRVANLKAYLPQFEDIHAFQAALQALLAGMDEEIRLNNAQRAQIEAEAVAKYRTWEWIYGHSPVAAFRVGKKFACGRVEAAFSLKAGCIDGLRFSGDFLGNLPAERIADALQGCRFTREAIFAVLSKEPVENCFDRLSAEELTALLVEA